MASVDINRLAIPAVTVLIAFLAYSSQYLFLYIEPAPLDKNQVTTFNLLVACIWVCYYRACFTDPGRVPDDWKPANFREKSGRNSANADDLLFESVLNRQRWCRRCEASKPPRAHHCKICQRCIPKMDHHCPWTANCVSHFTFPHFIRFLFYAVASMSYLEYFLYIRASAVWRNRHLPSYYGPSLSRIAHLILLVIVNSAVLLVLSILLARALWMLSMNQTTIEGWEIERHRTLVRRAKVFGGFLDGPDGMRIRIRKQEFPYDIGIWQNIRDWMGGTSNVLAWFFPFSATPSPGTGMDFEINGFEDPSVPWPPPDPDRLPRRRQPPPPSQPETLLFSSSRSRNTEAGLTSDSIAAFRGRQEADLRRQRRLGRQYGPATTSGNALVAGGSETRVQRRRPFHERYMQVEETGDEYDDKNNDDDDDEGSETEDSLSGEEGWRNAEGERLGDFGVDEYVEFYDYEEYRGSGGMESGKVDDEEDDDGTDEDDIPLAKLLERWKREKNKANG